MHTSIHSEFTGKTPGIPTQWFTAYNVLSPVIGLSCHRRPANVEPSAPGWADHSSARLDAGVEASGPHDFAVRISAVRLRAG